MPTILLPAGTRVTFVPARVDYTADGASCRITEGVVASSSPVNVDDLAAGQAYRINVVRADGTTSLVTRLDLGRDDECVRAIPNDVPVPSADDRVARSEPVVPRTAESAAWLRAVLTEALPEDAPILSTLDRLAFVLPGGELEDQAHRHAAEQTLCGEYEAVVCAGLGFTPRRGHESSMDGRRQAWLDAVAQHEHENRFEPVADVLASWAANYERGGPVNQAIIDHARIHLERSKVPAMNDLMDALDFDGLDNEAATFEVTVRVYRTRTIVEYADVVVERECADGDSGCDCITNDVEDAAVQESDDCDHCDWTWVDQDDDIDWDRTEITDISTR